ncbi:MAG TPA: FAD-dependent monooxygenase [Terriglobales bacterium]|nr:FAD-dependent monooxygenase [Terriglobales bacterium]
MSKIIDLVVIGGGPAGTSAAITAARLGFNVVVVEAGIYPRHKVCGEFVSGEALSLLRSFVGETPLLNHATRIATARIFVDDAKAEFRVDPPAASISRYDLDLALWQAALASGCCVRDRTCAKAVRALENLFVVQLDEEEIRARSVVNASGRWSNIRVQAAIADEHWIGLKGHFFESHASPTCDLYFFEGGYCGVQPLASNLVNVAAMVKPEVARNLEAVFAQNRYLADRVRKFSPVSESVSTAPLFFRAPRTLDRNMLLVGDAAAFLDPFAGDGISMAMHSGRLAALALAPYLQGVASMDYAIGKYDHDHRAVFQPALKNGKRLRTLSRLPRSLRAAAMLMLKLGPVSSAAIKSTRVKQAS